MKRMLSLLLSVIFVFGLVACNGESNSESNSDKQTNSSDQSNTIDSTNTTPLNELTSNDLSIEEFEWESSETEVNGITCYATTLINNSKHTIYSIEIKYKTKDTATDEDLKVFESFMAEHEGYIEEDDPINGVTLKGSREKLTKKGETIDQIVLTIGYGNSSWYDSPNKVQFDLMEPEKLEIGIIGEDNKAYEARYDFKDDSWRIDKKTKSVNSWPSNNLSKIIPEPTCEYYILTSDNDDEDIEVRAYGITRAAFENYASELQDLGFGPDGLDDYSAVYKAEDKQGNEISIYYYESDKRMSISAEEA